MKNQTLTHTALILLVNKIEIGKFGQISSAHDRLRS